MRAPGFTPVHVSDVVCFKHVLIHSLAFQFSQGFALSSEEQI